MDPIEAECESLGREEALLRTSVFGFSAMHSQQQSATDASGGTTTTNITGPGSGSGSGTGTGTGTAATMTRTPATLLSAAPAAAPGHAQLRAFASAMDKTLKAFDNCKEWADLIWFLGKVHKLLQAFQGHHAVPFKVGSDVCAQLLDKGTTKNGIGVIRDHITVYQSEAKKNKKKKEKKK